MLRLFGWDFLMFTPLLNSHYFHLSCLLTKALSIFYALFITTPLRHPWKQSPPSGEEKGCREPKKGSHRAVPFTFLLPCLLLSPLQAFSLSPSVSLCLSLLPPPSGPFCFHPEKRSRTNLAHPTCKGGSSEEHRTIGISGGSKHLGKKH